MADQNLQVKITGDSSSLNESLAQVRRNLTNLRGDVAAVSSRFAAGFAAMKTAVGVLGVAIGAREIVTGLKNIADHIDNVGKVAERIGMTTEALSELQYAAKMNGSSAEQMTVALQKLSINIGLAASGSGTAKNAFDAMGIKIKDANGAIKSTEQIFGEIADKFSSYQDGADKSALANAIFGKSGVELVNVLNLGKSGLSDMAAEARQFGQVVDSQAAKAAAQFNDDLSRLSSVATAAGQSLLKGLLPALSNIIERFVTALNASKGFWGFLQNFMSLSSSDFEAPSKAIDGYKSSITSLEGELKTLKEQQSETTEGSEEWEELQEQINDVEKSIRSASRAMDLLSPVAQKVEQREAAKAKQEAIPKSQAPAMKREATSGDSAAVLKKQKEDKLLAQLDDARSRREMELLEENVERQKASDDQLVAIGVMTNAQRLANAQKYEKDLYEVQRSALEERLALLESDPNSSLDAKVKLQTQMLELEKKHNKQVLLLDKQQTKERLKYVEQINDSMKSGFESVLAQFMDGQLTIKGLFEGLLDAVLHSFINMTAQMASEWMAKQLMMMAASDTKAAKDIANAAAEGGANATASMAGAPWPINMGAPAFGAAIAVAALGFKSYMSAAGGYDIPAGTNPLTQLHEKEMVLPASIAEPLRASLANKQNGGQTVVNLHGVSAGKFFVAAKKDLVRALKGANRDFAFA